MGLRSSQGAGRWSKREGPSTTGASQPNVRLAAGKPWAEKASAPLSALSLSHTHLELPPLAVDALARDAGLHLPEPVEVELKRGRGD